MSVDTKGAHQHKLPRGTAEDELAHIKRQNELILEAAGEGIYGLDCEGNTTFLNPAAATMLGWEVDALVGQPMHKLLHHTKPDGSAFPKEQCSIYAAFKDGAVHHVDDEVFWRKDGSSFPVDYTSTPIHENGKLAGAVVVFKDITERKQAEQELRKAYAEVEQMKERLEAENVYLQEEIKVELNHAGIVGQSHAMQQVLHQVELVAPTDASVLISGESGTGKELAARSIHDASDRQNQPFVSLNCAAIPDGLMESQLFGHERGAFTGADQKRKGKFELADKGTLLLDELGDLPGPLQAKLLRVLQESQFERVGGSKSISVDVRILACTSKDLQKEVEAGRFRQDLLYRLQVIPLKMPPLREHKEDIEILCNIFLQEFNSLHGKSVAITSEAIDCLKGYDFPGNARELRNLMERASVLCRGPEITPADLPTDLRQLSKPDDIGFNLSDNMAIAEQNCLKRALSQSNGNRTRTAKLLGISRKNLWEKLKNYNIQ